MASSPAAASTSTPADLAKVEEILHHFPKPTPSDVIPLLQAVQGAYGYLPAPVLEAMAQRTADFADPDVRRGHVLRAVLVHATRPAHGPALPRDGVPRARRETDRRLAPETSRRGRRRDDQGFEVQFRDGGVSRHLFLSPVMMVDDRFYGNLSPEKAAKILDNCA